MLVNSDTAVSVAHSVLLVGRCCCHMKRMHVSAFLLACSKRLSRWESSPTNTSEMRIQESWRRTPLSSPDSEKLISLWSFWHFWVCFLGCKAITLLLHCGCNSFHKTPVLNCCLIKIDKLLGIVEWALVGFNKVHLSNLIDGAQCNQPCGKGCSSSAGSHTETS